MRLANSSLARLPAWVRRPRYDRSGVRAGIVHLGIGAFFRAHGAVYTDDVLCHERDWAIVAASLRSGDTRNALGPQDGLYTLSVRSDEAEDLRVIGSILKVLVAPEDPIALVCAMTDPGVRIVTLTVTEKGYCHDPATGELNEAHPDIQHDLGAPAVPRSAPGIIIEALRHRRANGVQAFSVLSCDNLPSNGAMVRRILTRFAALRDPDLGAYVAADVPCPATMVDRITPATTEEDRVRMAAALTVEDAWPVVTEPFSQWVIEDGFGKGGRPDWDLAGAQFVADVAPYELMKLRLLNGAHSTLAYLGYLAGYETVADVMSNPAFVSLARGVMNEAAPTLPLLSASDLDAYKTALLERFRNPALRHRTWQICMDGSQKLPQRLLGTIRDCLRLGLPFTHLLLGVAGWMRYVVGTDERGAPIDVRDPLAAKLRTLAEKAGPNPRQLASNLLGVEQVFGSDLAVDPRLAEALVPALDMLFTRGARSVVEELAQAHGHKR
jgi:fructuronate reductase